MHLAEIARHGAVASIVAILAVALASACSTDPGCSDCAEGELCIDDECRKQCSAQDDCGDRLTCARVRSDDGGEGAYCLPLPGQFVECESDDDCAAESGFACVEDECRFACRSHFECSGVGYCAAIADGHYCVRDAPAEPGRYYTTCPNGAADCDTEASFTCVGAGPGDIDAYCTSDCSEDADCPAGFQCGTIRVAPCAPACGVAGSPNAPGCVAASEIGVGKTYGCGPLGVVRHVCEKRGFCSACERDEDCRAIEGQVCARDESGEKICTLVCDPSRDTCPWGNAARCGVWDSELAVPTCSHRFGACRGEGRGCEPCVDDEDCGESGFCSRFSFTGERYCIDLAAECDCAGDAPAGGTCLGHGCPETPGGLEMVCGAAGFRPNLLENRCFSASTSNSVLDPSSSQAGCWPRR